MPREQSEPWCISGVNQKTPQELEMYRHLELALFDLLDRVKDRLTAENADLPGPNRSTW